MTDWREAEIERLARVLVIAHAEHYPPDAVAGFAKQAREEMNDGQRNLATASVRDLLKALRDPKEEMLQAPVRVPGEPPISPRSRYFIWRTMIDALLDEHP